MRKPSTSSSSALWSGRLSRATKPIDPYVVWADLSEYRELKVVYRDDFDQIPATFNFIIELYPDVSCEQLLAALRHKLDGTFEIQIPEVYFQPVAGKSQARFITAMLNHPHTQKQLCDKTDDESRRCLRDAIWKILECPLIKRLQLGFPRGPGTLEEPAGRVTGLTANSRKTTRSPVAVAASVIGIIEDFVPFAHQQLRSNNGSGYGSRILTIWDQSRFRKADSPQSPWTAAKRFGYGHLLEQKRMNEAMQQSYVDGEVDEELCYGEMFGIALGGAASRFKKEASHGAAVLCLAAGREAVRQDYGADDVLRFGPREAPVEVPVLAVQLPGEQTQISSGRWLAVNALDALRFLLLETRERFRNHNGKMTTLVVNLSYGSIAGPHDGTGMLESAMDELIESDRELAIVLAAGNSRGARTRAAREVKSNHRGEFLLLVPPDKSFETYVEFWVPKDDVDFVVEATTPSGETLQITTPNESGKQIGPIAVRTAGQDAVAALIAPPSGVPQGTNANMILLVVSPTQLSASRPEAPAGVWRIAFHNRHSKTLKIDAWVERDDQMGGQTRPQSAKFVETADTLSDDSTYKDHLAAGSGINRGYIREDNTFTNIATGDQTFVVGAELIRKGATTKPYLMAPYSSEAKDASKGPTFSAKADLGWSQGGIRVHQSISGAWGRVNGTSLAAPQVTRWIVQQVETGMTLGAIRASLPLLGRVVATSPDGARTGRKRV